jgi:hypothetical protein
MGWGTCNFDRPLSSKLRVSSIFRGLSLLRREAALSRPARALSQAAEAAQGAVGGTLLRLVCGEPGIGRVPHMVQDGRFAPCDASSWQPAARVALDTRLLPSAASHTSLPGAQESRSLNLRP